MPDAPLLARMDELVESLRTNTVKAIKQWDEEAIHDARVATRRLKAALDLLEDVISLDHREPFAKTLKKLRRRLGPLRDLDVMLASLKRMEQMKRHEIAVRWLADRLATRRSAAREEATKAGSPARVVARLGRWWGLRQELEEASLAIDTLLAESIHLQLDTFAEQAQEIGTSDPHPLRIAGKRLRYTLELAAVQGHELPKDVLRTFKKMQDELGRWHDQAVLAQCAMQASFDAQLPMHDPALQTSLLDFAKLMVTRSAKTLSQFAGLWQERGTELAAAVRAAFPLAHAVKPPKTDRDPIGSTDIPAPAAQPPIVAPDA